MLLFVLFLCCNNKKNNHELSINKPKFVSDSIIISLRIKSNIPVGFNFYNKYLESNYVDFINKTGYDSIVEKKIPRYFKHNIIDYGYINRSGETPKLENQFFLIHNSIKRIDFEYNNWKFKKLKNKINFLDSLFNSYESISSDLQKEKLEKKYKENRKLKYIKENYDLQQINDYIFYNFLQRINPKSKEVDFFIKNNIKIPIASSTLRSLLFFHVKNNIDTIDFKTFNKNKYSKEYVNLFSLGLYSFLSFEDNKGDKKYKEAINWFKTSNLYKNDSIYLRKKITPLNNKVFKEKLKNIKLQDIEDNIFSFSKIIKQNPSNYYLIDFWATWCSPCIEGVYLIKKMDIPKNVSVISLSIDKSKDKQKWEKMTKKLGQKISYLVKNKNIKNQEFLKFIELQSVPRYILIDKNLNLIDEAFYHPNEPQFLPKLKDVKYAKYW